MTEGDLEIIFDMMGENLKRPDKHGNRSAKCPLAPWTHTKGRDKNPSLTAKIAENGIGVYRCWACHNEGTVFELAKMYGENSNDYRPLDYVKSLFKGHFFREWEYGAKEKKISKAINFKLKSQVSEDNLKRWLEYVPQYAIDRGLNKAQIQKWEIGFDQQQNRMIIPIRDYLGKLIGISGRDVTGNQQPKYRHYLGSNKELVLYGEQFIDRMSTTAQIVEGFMDVWKFERLGIGKNTFASMGTSLSDQQIDKICRWFKKVIFIPDCDDAGFGLQFAQTYGERLVMKGLKVGVAGCTLNPDYRHREKPKDWEPSDYRFMPIDELKGREPEALDRAEADVVLNQVSWVTLGGPAYTPESIF